ncbi:MAG: TolC family protein [Sphingomonadales bacterium]|jgi:CRISPR system Cascade subunit CasA
MFGPRTLPAPPGQKTLQTRVFFHHQARAPRHAPAAALALCLLLPGCLAAPSAPLAPAAVAAHRAGQSLSREVATPVLARIAPTAAATAMATYGRWDRLALFAFMLANNPDIAAARAAIASAEAARRASRVRPGPFLSLSGEYAGASPDASPWLYGAAIDLPIDSGGRRASRLRLADLTVVAARYDYAETVWTVRGNLRQGLLDRLIGEARRDAAAAILAVRQRQFDAVARRVAAGAASRAELERVRADAADALHRQADALTEITAGNAAIAAALGVPVAEVAGQAFSWDTLAAPEPIADVGAAARDAAVAARADVLRAATAYDQAEADLRGEIARQYPALSVGAGYSWDHGLVRLPFNLGLTLPPLDGNRSNVRTALARRAEAGTRLEASVAAAQVAIDSAVAASLVARAALDRVRQRELPAAQRLAQQADNELKAGSIDTSEWAAAQAGALLARLSELDALMAVHGADGQLEAALRRPVAGPERAIGPRLEGMQ